MKAKKGVLIRRLMNNPVLIHTLVGIAIGYFLLHPITMVIYWFQNTTTIVTFKSLIESFDKAFIHAFYLHMMPMSVAFIIIGGVTGLSSGLYTRRIHRQTYEIQMQRYQLKESIRSIIKNGENENVEFKKSFRYDSRVGHPEKSLEDLVMNSVAGFMNAKGGILLLGVEKDGRIKGLADDYFCLGRKSREGFEQKFLEMVATKLGTDICQFVHLTFHEIGDVEISSVYIEKVPRPVYIHLGEKTTFYLRLGNITKSLNTEETVDYLKII